MSGRARFVEQPRAAEGHGRGGAGVRDGPVGVGPQAELLGEILAQELVVEQAGAAEAHAALEEVAAVHDEVRASVHGRREARGPAAEQAVAKFPQ